VAAAAGEPSSIGTAAWAAAAALPPQRTIEVGRFSEKPGFELLIPAGFRLRWRFRHHAKPRHCDKLAYLLGRQL
jgi:hypothetical protein